MYAYIVYFLFFLSPGRIFFRYPPTSRGPGGEPGFRVCQTHTRGDDDDDYGSFGNRFAHTHTNILYFTALHQKRPPYVRTTHVVVLYYTIYHNTISTTERRLQNPCGDVNDVRDRIIYTHTYCTGDPAAARGNSRPQRPDNGQRVSVLRMTVYIDQRVNVFNII